MPNFNTGKLQPNKVYGAVYNMILNQVVNGKNISREYAEMLNAAKKDVGLFGDTKLYYETYSPPISDWKGDDESTDLLETKKYRVKSPECQALVIDTYKKVVLVLDRFLTKQAWMQEGAFSQFTSVMMAWIRDVKDKYEIDTFNTFVGTEESTAGKQSRQVDMADALAASGEEKNRLEAQLIAKDQADLLTDLMDNTKDYIDYGQNGMIRGFSKDDLCIVMPASVANRITKLDEPTIFHKDGLLADVKRYVFPDRYFGKVNAAATKGVADGTVRSRIHQVIGSTEYFAGDAITDTTATAPANTSYTTDSTILYKVFAKNSVPFLSAFEATGSFYNCQALNEKYVTVLGHNTLEHLKGKPCITVRSK